MYNVYIYRLREREREREIQTGGGFEDMEFSGVLKKYHVEILEVN